MQYNTIVDDAASVGFNVGIHSQRCLQWSVSIVASASTIVYRQVRSPSTVRFPPLFILHF